MNKKIIVPILTAALCVCTAVGCTTGGNNGKKPEPVDQKGINLYPYSNAQGTYMGDVMPFYDDGVMNIYHLQDKVGSLYMFYHPISRLTTTDYLHYTDEGIALNYEEDISSYDAALGTGSVVKDSAGKYHFFYTGHGVREEVAPGPLEVIRHATSTDQKTWTKDEDFKLEGNSAEGYLNDDFRDPYVYYDSEAGKYYMLVTAREKNADTGNVETGVIKYYASTTLDAAADEWEYKGIFFRNDAGTYNMECPSYIELNGWYYLAYSEQGSSRVTHYRYKTTKDGEWQKFDRDSIDNEGFYAGRLEKAGDKLYAFAWCAKLTKGDYGVFDWGGSLVAHEIVRQENGELSAVMVSAVKEALNTKVDYKPVSGRDAGTISFEGNKFAAKGFDALTGNATRMSFKVKLGSDKGDFGLTFGVDGDYDNRLGKALIAFEPENGRLACYNDVTSVLRYGSLLVTQDFTFEKDHTYNVDVLYQNDLCSVYLDGKVAFTVRMPKTAKQNFAFYSNGTKVDVSEIAFYE